MRFSMDTAGSEPAALAIATVSAIIAATTPGVVVRTDLRHGRAVRALSG